MPLVHADVEVASEFEADRTGRTLRRINKGFTDGPLVKVAWARHQAEAELIQGLLSEAGVPSMLRRARGFDVPDMLAAGQRDVLVPESGVEVAREVLLEAELVSPDASAAGPDPLRLFAGVAGAAGVVALVIWIGTELVG